MSKYNFNCGCAFDKLDYNNLRLDCPATWQLIQSGRVKGLFQIEGNLGRSWVRRLKPENIEHLAALCALLRPSCLEAKDEKGISMTEHYVLRKNNKEPVSYYHPALEEDLSNTYGILTYQEQAMSIARHLAGFSLQEADNLRKGIGKKLPEVIAKVEKQFVDGCAKVGILNVSEAQQIFEWIKAGQRYAFNASHSFAYALNTYRSGYVKTHFPVNFYKSWLQCSIVEQDPMKEMAELIEDSRMFDVDVRPPDIRRFEKDFSLDQKTQSVFFGFLDIKGIGDSAVESIEGAWRLAQLDACKGFALFDWYEVLVFFSPGVTRAIMVKLIEAGAFSYLEISRTKLLEELRLWYELTARERDWIVEQEIDARKSYPEGSPKFGSLEVALATLAETDEISITVPRRAHVKNILRTLQVPGSALKDHPLVIADLEERYLGIALTSLRVDAYGSDLANMTCREFVHGGNATPIILCVEIKDVNVRTVKSGKNEGREMARLKVMDATGGFDDVTIFADEWDKCKHLLEQGKVVLLRGNRGTDYYANNFIVRDVIETK
jgi:DNA polymerase III alpha subunit